MQRFDSATLEENNLKFQLPEDFLPFSILNEQEIYNLLLLGFIMKIRSQQKINTYDISEELQGYAYSTYIGFLYNDNMVLPDLINIDNLIELRLLFINQDYSKLFSSPKVIEIE